VLLVLQFPFADVRPFIPGASGLRLRAPQWPTAEIGKEFVRGYGVVAKRRKGGVEEWPGERLYCQARAIRFAASPRALIVGDDRRPFALDCAFRRFFSDGESLVRVEFGFRLTPTRRMPSVSRAQVNRLPLSGQDLLSLITAVLDLPVRIQPQVGTATPGARKFHSCTMALAAHYLYATTSRQHGNGAVAPPSWQCQAGAPIVFVEYEDHEVSDAPRGRPVKPMELAKLRLTFGDHESEVAGIWFLGVAPGANQDTLRRLRINLLRFHAERECLKQVLRLLRKPLPVVAGTPESDELQQFLDRSTTVLMKPWRESLPQSEILTAAYQFDQFVTEGERADLLAALASVRRAVFRKVERFTETIIVQGDLVKGDKTVQNKNLTIKKSTVGNVTQADVIVDSFNQIQTSDASAEMKAALTTLTEAVDAMLKARPEQAEQDEKTKRSLEVLTKEATAATPDRAWYEVSANGLIEAAKTVGAIGAPVINAVKVVLGLLAPLG
jgi:hypothetical protein